MAFRDVMRKTDVGLILTLLFLIGFGGVAVYSAGASLVPGDPFFYLRRQLVWVLVGAVVAVSLTFIDYRRLRNYVVPLYVLNIALLAGIFVMGRTAMGAQRWIEIGWFRFQPSEFAKLAVIITLAAYLAKQEGDMGLRQVMLALAHVAGPMLLIVVQPDMGTTMVFGAVLLAMLLVAGIQVRHLAIIVLLVCIVAAGVFHFQLLHEYQMNRLVVFLNPDTDPSDSGYNLRQSIIAVGSGQLLGKGLFSGTQSRLNFIPERHTDFIFAVVGEEAGFAGGAVLLLGFFLLLTRTLGLGSLSRNQFGLLLATGIAAMWAFQVLVNIGMTIGIMPITGIPLPFVSYGGSAIMTNLAAAGLLLSTYRHRFS